MNIEREQVNRIAQGLGWFSIGLGAAEVLAPDQMAKIIGVRESDRRVCRPLHLVLAHPLNTDGLSQLPGQNDRFIFRTRIAAV